MLFATVPMDVTEKSRVARIAAASALVVGLVALPSQTLSTMPATHLLATLLLAAGLSLLSAIDLVSLRLPDILTLPLLAIGLALAATGSAETLAWHAGSALLGGLALYLVGWAYLRYRGMDGLGLGDAKLFAVAGAWVGAEGLSSVLLIACGSALLAALLWHLSGKTVDRRSALPFGPFLSLGLCVVWLYGPLA